MKKDNKTSESSSNDIEKSELLNIIEAQRVELEKINGELKIAKDSAEKTNSKITTFDNFTTAGFFTLAPDSTILNLNLSGAIMLGRDLSDLLNSRFNLFLTGENKPVFNDFLKKVFKFNSRETCELKMEIKDKSPVFIHIEGRVPENQKKCFLTAIDITDRKLIENTYIKNELRFSRALDATSDGFYDMDVVTNTAFCNSRYYSMLGYNLYELPPTTDTWVGQMHPDDLESALSKLNKQLSAKDEFLEQEYRQKHKSGRWVWILDRSRIMEYDGLGNPIRIIGTHTDITERKIAEKKIRNLLREKEIMLMEVNHRIKNNMLSVQFLIRAQSNKYENIEVKNTLRDASNRLQSMAVLYDKLYRSSNTIESSTSEYLPALIHEIIKVLPENESLKVITEIEDIVLHSKILSPIGMIINELLSNSMKYAFAGRNDCIIIVKASKKGNRVLISYKDNGIGIPDSVTIENPSGFGMQLVSMLTEQIDGSMRIERENGSEFILEFDI